MLSVTVPTPVRKVADRFKDLFSDTSLNCRCLCALFCMHLYGLPSLSAAVCSLGWTVSVSSLQRAVQSFEGSRHLSPAEWGQTNASSETIGTRIKKIRELGLSQTLITMLFNPEHNAVVHLKNRRQAGRINKKPVNCAAEDAKCRKSCAA